MTWKSISRKTIYANFSTMVRPVTNNTVINHTS